MPAVGTQHVNILPPSLLGRRAPLGRALGRRRRSITEAFLRDGSKDSLGFGGLWQTAWGPLKAPTQMGWRERIKPGGQRRLFIQCEKRQSGFKINFHPLLLLLFTLGVSGYGGWKGWTSGPCTVSCEHISNHNVHCKWGKLPYHAFQLHNLLQSKRLQEINYLILRIKNRIIFKIDWGGGCSGVIHPSCGGRSRHILHLKWRQTPPPHPIPKHFQVVMLLVSLHWIQMDCFLFS